MSTKSIAEEAIEKTYRELGFDPKTGKFNEKLGESRRNDLQSSSPNFSYPSPNSSYHLQRPKTPFRIVGIEKTTYQSVTGTTYKYSALFRNAVVMQLLIEKFTSGLDPKKYHRLIVQDNDAARSMIANIAEGYARPTTKEYLDFLGFSKASLEEIVSDIVHYKDLGLLPSRAGTSLVSVGILFKPTTPYSPDHSSAPLNTSYDPLRKLKRKIGEIKREALTFEVFMELINKTSYLYTRTVEGVWNKLTKDEQNKLRDALHNLRNR